MALKTAEKTIKKMFSSQTNKKVLVFLVYLGGHQKNPQPMWGGQGGTKKVVKPSKGPKNVRDTTSLSQGKKNKKKNQSPWLQSVVGHHNGHGEKTKNEG